MSKLPQKQNRKLLAVPYSIRIFQKCCEYSIDFELVKHLHMYDLQCLIIQFDIQNVERYLQSKQHRELRAKGIGEIKNLSGSEALKFLGR